MQRGTQAIVSDVDIHLTDLMEEIEWKGLITLSCYMQNSGAKLVPLIDIRFGTLN